MKVFNAGSLVLLVHVITGLALNEHSVSRRQVIGSSLLIGGASWSGAPPPATAARGAAELDFEFYMRDLIGGNKKEGNIQASSLPTLAPPRTLKSPLLPLLLNEECTSTCVAVQALVQQIQQRTGQDEKIISQDITNRVQDLRERSKRSFRVRAPWQEENIADQYYFDFTSYLLWRTAADLLPDYVDRDKFVRRLGKLLYQRLLSEQFIRPPKVDKRHILEQSIPTTLEILNLFKSSGFCKDYRIRGDDSKDLNDPAFDDLDDESLETGGTVDCLVSVFEPATLGASLQITGEQSRFGPDFVGTTLAALWDDLGVKSSWETYFVDPEYRPNPKDYFPNEQLVQYTLTKK